ncbi:MAG: TetR/AcrR family transcriptional regulator [Xanthobacteraceae bacterium]
MAQVKKAALREAILAAAYRLFRDQGYNGSTLSEIAAEAGISTANLYSYFRSKLDILYCIYEPWLHERFRRLEKELSAIRDPRKRLRRLIAVLWRDIPAEANGFANNIIQAVSGAEPEEGYDPSLLHMAEGQVSNILRETLPPDRLAVVDVETLAHLLFMAFDGFAMSVHVNQEASCGDGEIDLICNLVLGSPNGPSRPKPPVKSNAGRKASGSRTPRVKPRTVERRDPRDRA